MISLPRLIGFYLGRGVAPQGGGSEHDAHDRVVWLLEFLDHNEVCVSYIDGASTKGDGRR